MFYGKNLEYCKKRLNPNMKENIFLRVVPLFLSLQTFAATNMVVELKNGESNKYCTDDVEMVYIQEISNYVDLGLPSGTLWASCNVGSSRPEEVKDYYAWGETTTKKVYDESTYTFNQNYALDANGAVDSIASLLPENDAATVNLGADWRMPTIEEWKELQKYCKWSWRILNGMSGSLFTAENGNWIFLPSAGVFMYNAVNQSANGGNADYWSSSLAPESEPKIPGFDGNLRAHYLLSHFNGDHTNAGDAVIGLPVRPVLAKKVTDSDRLPQETVTYMCVRLSGANQKLKKIEKFDVENVKQVVFEEKIYDEQQFVDLGLPSGTLWAAYNLGAKKPEEAGDFFSWGETKTKNMYSGYDTKFLSQFTGGAVKYCEEDSIATLLAEDDAATCNWGPDWRTPTMDDFRELCENCQWTREELNGVVGSKFTADNGAWIFIPAAGYRYNDATEDMDDCFCWSSSVKQEYKFKMAYIFSSNKSGIVYDEASFRGNGLPIRPVRVK